MKFRFQPGALAALALCLVMCLLFSPFAPRAQAWEPWQAPPVTTEQKLKEHDDRLNRLEAAVYGKVQSPAPAPAVPAAAQSIRPNTSGVPVYTPLTTEVVYSQPTPQSLENGHASWVETTTVPAVVTSGPLTRLFGSTSVSAGTCSGPNCATATTARGSPVLFRRR